MSKQEFRNRIVGVADVDPRSLVPNPLNWRVHTDRQSKTMKSALQEIGWIQDIIVNRNTGRLIDGHMRLSIALEDGAATVPVKFVDLTEEEERKAIATLDPISALAQADTSKLNALIGSIDKGSSALGEMLASMATAAPVIPPSAAPFITGGDEILGGPTVAYAPSQADGTTTKMETNEPGFADQPTEVKIGGGVAFQLNDEVFFDSDLPYAIPPLRPDRLGTVDIGIRTWAGDDVSDLAAPQHFYSAGSGNTRNLDWKKVVLNFYTDDFRWEALVWDKTTELVAKILNARMAGVVVPNFSTYWEWPKAIRIYNRYRSMWAGRFMQEAGIPVIPDFQYCPGDEDCCFSGIPRNAPVIAVQYHTAGQDTAYLEKKIAGLNKLMDYLAPQLILIYSTEQIFAKIVAMTGLDNLKWLNTRGTMRAATRAKERRL